MRGQVTRKGKRWYPVVYLGVDDQGRKRYKWMPGHDTKKSAEKALAGHLQDVHAGRITDALAPRLSEFAARWLAHKSTQVRPRTVEIYARTLRLHVADRLGNVRLDRLTANQLRAYYADLASVPLSNRYIAQIHTLLNDICETAVRWDVIARNPVNKVDPPRPEVKRFTVWTLQDAQTFLSAASGHRFYAGFVLALTTGMRQGEILALRWEDIDLDGARIFVRRTASHVGSKLVYSDPKSRSGIRVVAIPPETVQALRDHRDRQNEQRDDMGSAYVDRDLVLARVNGNPVTQAFLRAQFMALCERAGVPVIRFHDLRHTHASLLLQQGVHPKIVSERLGHSKISITLDTYSHVLPGLQEQAANAFGNALFGPPKIPSDIEE